ncbi:arrestin domain-containing protein 3-like [Conger conger]|uniref:arrestin domain-containing protein 3-like n=1 Tax=Conger conger TaxID=82655 RepID=UPI002A5A6C97|nr:arrestin domain-containing protein 3-like [Conger conger]
MKSDVIQQNGAIGGGETVLRGGTHVYPFIMPLPQGDFPSAFQGVHGRVTYALVVEIHRPWHFAKEFRAEFNFVSHIDANHPQLLEPLAASNSKELCCLCCTSGSVAMNAYVERKGYVPGEMIQINAEFENYSSRTIVPKAMLVQTQTFYTISRSSRRTVMKELVKIEGRHLMPNSTGVWGDQMLQIPANTPLTISNCQILEVDYYLQVSLKIPNGVNLKVIIPLVICSIPVDRPPAVF